MATRIWLACTPLCNELEHLHRHRCPPWDFYELSRLEHF